MAEEKAVGDKHSSFERDLHFMAEDPRADGGSRGLGLPRGHCAWERNRRLDTETIFRELIRQEILAGRLNRTRRRRVVRYAAQLGLSAVEAGEMIKECRRAALPAKPSPHEFGDEPQEPAGRSRCGRIALVAAALILELLLLAWVC